jgi:hypothetical protein
MSTDITTWRVGDRAYISGHPTDGCLSHGDIVRVTKVRRDGMPRFGPDCRSLDASDCEPLRILTPGDVVPKGARYLRIPKHGEASECQQPYSWDVVSAGNLYAIIALPEPSPEDVKRDEILTRLDAVQAAVKALRSEVVG